MEYLASEWADPAIISHDKRHAGHCSQATVDGQVLLSYYCYWLLGPWDMEAELKCFALSNSLLCNFTSSLCCSHELLTSRFPSLFIWFLFGTLCKVHFQYHLHHSGLFMICLLGYMAPRTGLRKKKFISRKSNYLPVHLHCLSRLNSKSYDAEQGWRTVG